MSLFQCSNCGFIENTALSYFWVNGKGQCAGCDPDVGGGKPETIGKPLVSRMKGGPGVPHLPVKGQQLVRYNDKGETEYYNYGEDAEDS